MGNAFEGAGAFKGKVERVLVKSQEGNFLLGAHIKRKYKKQINTGMVETGFNMKAMLIEAVNDWFEKNGLEAPIGEDA